MIAPRFIPVIVKQLVRHRTRTLLTLGGVAVAMFLFVAVQAMQRGVREATDVAAGDTTLIVYRENRFCPATSRLPEYYGDRIVKVPGVKSAVPMKIEVTNCRTSLDVITFRGVPPELFAKEYAANLRVAAGSFEGWMNRSDAALVGEELAARRGFRVGDSFSALGINVYVAGIIRSDEPQDRNAAYVHLPFLQRSTGAKKLGVVTQFSVKVDDSSRLAAVARAIDDEFQKDPEPTSTSPEKAFVAKAAADVVEIISFTRWLGWGCLAAVLGLVANAIVLSVQERVRDHAILQTLGYTSGLIGRFILVEGLILGVVGGGIGAAAAMLVNHFGRFALSAEGLSIAMTADARVMLAGVGISALLGVLAGAVPAAQAARREIAACFRAV